MKFEQVGICRWSQYRMVDREGQTRRLLKVTAPIEGIACFRLLDAKRIPLAEEKVPPDKIGAWYLKGEWHFGFWIPEHQADKGKFILVGESKSGEQKTEYALHAGEPGPGDNLPLRLDRLGDRLREHLETREKLPTAGELADFAPDMADYLYQHRIIYERPAEHWSEGLPLGNGIVGATVSGIRGKQQTFHLDRADLWANSPQGRPYGRFYAGRLDIHYSGNENASSAHAAPYLQFLDLHAAEVKTRDGTLTTVARVNAVRDVFELHLRSESSTPLAVRIFLSRPAMPLLDQEDMAPLAMVNGSWHAIYSEEKIEAARRLVEAAPHTDPQVEMIRNYAVLSHRVPNMCCVLASALVGVEGTWQKKSLPRQAQAALEIVIPPGGEARLFVAVMSDRAYPDPKKEALKLLDRSAAILKEDQKPDGIDEHRRWWHKFWERSFVEFPDKLMENLWYFGAYHQAAFSRSLDASGFFGLWHPLDHRTWGDYFTDDAQVELLWWAPFAVNHLELLLPSHHTFSEHLPAFLAYNPGEGALIPHWFAPYWAGGLMTFGQSNPYKGSIAWTALNFWWDYLFTRDRTFLAEVGYSMIAACADFHAADLVRQTDGRLHCVDSHAPEQQLTSPDNCYDWACIGAVLQAAVQAADVLNVDADRAAHWRATLSDLFNCPADETTLVETIQNPHPYRCHPVVLFGIHPTSRIEPGNPLWTKANATYDVVTNLFGFHYEDRHKTIPGHIGGQEPNGHATAFLMHAAARLRGWNEVRRLFYALAVRTQLKPNGLRSISDPRHDRYLTNMAISEGTSGQTSGLTETLIQNYSDHIRVMANLPEEGMFRFSGLRAHGGFILAGEHVDGKVTHLVVHSLKGETMRMLNPWPGRNPDITPSTRIQRRALADGSDGLEFGTRPGVTYSVSGGVSRSNERPGRETREGPRKIRCGDWDDFIPPVVYYPEDLPFAQDKSDGQHVFLGLPREIPSGPALPSWECIQNLLKSSQWPARQTAARWLGKVRTEEAINVLKELANNDPTPVVRYTAGVSLIRMAVPSALQAALQIAQSTSLPHQRREILKALTRLVRTDIGRKQLAEAFTELGFLQTIIKGDQTLPG